MLEKARKAAERGSLTDIDVYLVNIFIVGDHEIFWLDAEKRNHGYGRRYVKNDAEACFASMFDFLTMKDDEALKAKYGTNILRRRFVWLWGQVQ